jgi:hypothetical protein
VLRKSRLSRGDPHHGSAYKTPPATKAIRIHPAPLEAKADPPLTGVIPLGQVMREGEDTTPLPLGDLQAVLKNL